MASHQHSTSAVAEPVGTGQHALRLEGVRSGYGQAYVIHGIDCHVAPGEIFVFLGKNGMGKTTLLKTIMGYLTTRQGTVEVLGTDVSSWKPYRVAGLGVSYIPQERALFYELSVEENLRVAMGGRPDFDERLDEVAEWFPFVKERLKQKAGTLSGGQQKMLLMSRALMTTPRLLLIDEITEGLQPSMIDRVREVLSEQRQRRGTTIVLVEHNIDFGLAVADRYAVLNLGRIVETGSTATEGVRQTIERHLTLDAQRS